MIFERGGEHFTVIEAADFLDLTTGTVLKQIEKNRMWAQKVTGSWFVPRTEAERYAREVKGKPGRPRRVREDRNDRTL